jgi:2-keto-4-pentenoate hydratase
LAFELVASRFIDRKTVDPLEGMADSFSAGGIVLGDALETGADELPDSLGITLWLDDQRIETTEIAQPLGDAIAFLSWLSDRAAKMGLPLRKGDVIITGARVGPLPLGAARMAKAQVGHAVVSARF